MPPQQAGMAAPPQRGAGQRATFEYTPCCTPGYICPTDDCTNYDSCGCPTPMATCDHTCFDCTYGNCPTAPPGCGPRQYQAPPAPPQGGGAQRVPTDYTCHTCPEFCGEAAGAAQPPVTQQTCLPQTCVRTCGQTCGCQWSKPWVTNCDTCYHNCHTRDCWEYGAAGPPPAAPRQPMMAPPPQYGRDAGGEVVTKCGQGQFCITDPPPSARTCPKSCGCPPQPNTKPNVTRCGTCHFTCAGLGDCTSWTCAPSCLGCPG